MSATWSEAGRRSPKFFASRNSLFDNLVGSCKQHRRHLDAKQPGGLLADDELELDRLNDRQIGRLLVLEDAADVSKRRTLNQIKNAYDLPDQLGVQRLEAIERVRIRALPVAQL
jgi:hypothetical protein